MAILHGSWLLQPQEAASAPLEPDSSEPKRGTFSQEGCLFLWGETWRRIDPTEFLLSGQVMAHPFAMASAELIEFVRSLQQSNKLNLSLPEVVLGNEITATAPSGRSRKRKGTAQQVAEVEALTPAVSTRWRSHLLALPTQITATAAIPQHSANSSTDVDTPLYLQPWQIDGFWLTPEEAVKFLNSLPLSSFETEDSVVGEELRFWSHVSRWSLDLLARSKFLPTLDNSTGSPFACWHPLLDSSLDQSRLKHFAQHMPPVCQMYQGSWELGNGSSTRLSVLAKESRQENANYPLAVELPPPSQTLLLGVLQSLLDIQIRNAIATQPLPTLPSSEMLAVREWLQALGAEDSRAIATSESLEQLQVALDSWTAPIQHQLTQNTTSFRTCFYLHPPAPGKTDWSLEYFLQAANNPDFLVSAATVWSNPVEQLVYLGRTIDHPQETLLAGLGLASRLYPLIEPSLQVQRPQFCLLNPIQAYEFIKAAAWRLQDSGFGVVLPLSLQNQQGWASRLGLRVRAEAPTPIKNKRLGLQSLLNFKWELSIGGQSLSKAEFDRLVALNTPLVEINGEWVELRSQDIRAAQAFFESRKDQMNLSLEDAVRISTGDTQTIEKLPVVSFEASGALQDLINTLTSGNQSVEPLPVPKNFQGELRPYQVRGMSWLAFLDRWSLGACLADDMGLGKTIQLIAFLLHLKEQGGLEQPTLLVCPTSVLGNWEREVKRFAPSLEVTVHHGDKRPQGKAFAKAVKGKDLIITSYALIHRDAKDLQSVVWEGVVLDEAQNIKNPEAKQSQAVRELQTQFRIALTGTPVENRLSELWSILDFLNPGYLGPRNFFQRRFAIPIERYGDTASLQTLRSLVQPFILRRLKTDRDIIQDLPEKQEMTVFCGLAAEQAALYQKAVDKSLAAIESADGIKRRGMILALLVKLKQICNHPILLKSEADENEKKTKQKASLLTHPSPQNLSGKLQRLEEMLEELLAEGDRALIFTQFAEWGKLLKDYLEQRFGRETLLLYGGTSKKQREEMVDRFQNDPQGPRLFILSLKAGGVGLNLTRANHVFHFDRWWNPAVENQATDRVFRIGQTRNVQVHKFVCTGTLEERIHELIESKKALSEQVVGAGEQWLTELDTDQLRNLLVLDRSAVIDEGAGS